jgi:CHAT domain-containing protein/tetratricopeptide (TPR) repeat protein
MPGSVLSRDLAVGNSEVFEISLHQNQLLRLSIDKGDLLLSLVLYDPEGRKVIQQLSRVYEVLEVSLPAESAGMYRAEISSQEREASAHFQLKVESVSTATADDREAEAAQQLIAKASVLRADWTEASLRQAIEKYDGAALVWRSVHNLRSAALASMSAGRVCFVLGDYREALKRYQAAADEAKTAGAKLEESQALSQIGRLYSYLGRNDAAQENLRKALDFLADDRAGNQPATVKQARAQALSNQGEINYSKGNLVKSGSDFADALKFFTEVGDRGGAARVHLFKGYIAGGIGEPEKAVAEILTSLALYQAVAHKAGEGMCLTALGLSHSLSREEDQAIKLHREAGAIFRTIGDRQSEGITFNALGQAYELLSDYPMALDNYRKALRLFQDNGSPDFAAVALAKVGTIYRLSNDPGRALAYYKQSLDLSRSARKKRTEAIALNEVALVYASQGSREKTVRQYQKILEFYDDISDRRSQAKTLNNLGDFLLGLGEKKEALDSYKRALPLSEQAGDKDVLISNLFNIARASRDLDVLDEAKSYIERSVKIIDNLRTNVATPDFRTSYFAGVRKQYDLYIDILMRLDGQRPGQGFAAAALLQSENARARSLVDLLIESRANIRQGAAPALLERERELKGLIRSQARYQMELAINGANPNENEEVTRQVDQLRAEYQEVETQLRDQNPRFMSIAQPQTLTLAQIQAELRGGDNILLEYALGDERSYLWVVTSDSFRSYELPARAVLERTGREVYQSLTARQPAEKIDAGFQAKVEAADKLYDEKALELSRMLLGQVADQLGNSRLIVVSEGVLQYIPLGALPNPQPAGAEPNAGQTSTQMSEDLPPLIETHEVITLPSFSTLLTIRQGDHKTSSSNRVVAVLADPVFAKNDERVEKGKAGAVMVAADARESSASSGLSEFEGRVRSGSTARLPHASEEADAILAAAPRGTGMIAKGFDASRETAMSSLIGEYKIVHFATHGFLNSEHPEMSGIVLTMVRSDGTQTNGFMPLQDIYNMNLSADLVVLSACDTALGKDIKGEGLVGLTRGFISAGSRSVVASLWKVDDRATAVLMENFYKSMLQEGLPPAAALRAATLKIRQEKRWHSPYFWAGFVLQGEYRDRIVVDSNSSPRLGLTVALALVLMCGGLLVRQRRRRSWVSTG